MVIKGKCVVTLHYSLTDDAGQQIDASHEQEPLVYLHDSLSLLPGLEKAITGKQAGDHFQITVEPEEGYGEPDPALVHTVPLSAFDAVDNLEVGMQFELESEEGHGERFAVTAIEGDEVTVDANHSLAGQVLHFDVRIESVRKATAAEIEAGYAII